MLFLLFRDPLQIYKFLFLIYHSYSLFSIYFLLEQFPLTMGKTFYIKLLTSQQIESEFELFKHIFPKINKHAIEAAYFASTSMELSSQTLKVFSLALNQIYILKIISVWIAVCFLNSGLWGGYSSASNVCKTLQN